MRAKIYFSFLACLLLSFQTLTGQTIKTVGATGADYPNLTTAFQAVNNGTLTGNITFQIISSITEPVGNGAMLIGKGEVGYVNITAAGSGFYPGDSVYFSDPGPGGTRAHGFIQTTTSTPGGAQEIYITDPGSGYTGAPTVTFGGSGTGAAGTAMIGGNYSSITIYPTGSGYTISANAELSTIELIGADNVTIDGRVNRTGSLADLTIVNTNSSYSILTNQNDRLHALHLSADATNNVFRYVKFKSSYYFITSTFLNTFNDPSSNSKLHACIQFGRGIFQGNSNNTIEYCHVTKNGSGGVLGIASDGYPPITYNYPGNIYSPIYQDFPVGTPNSNNTIRNNNIYDLVNQGSSFIYLRTNSTGWLIEGNSFYQQTAITTSAANESYSIITVLTGENHIIRNNYLGGSAPLAGGAAWNQTVIGQNYRGLFCINFTPVSGVIENNIIRNFDLNLPGQNGFFGINSLISENGIQDVNSYVFRKNIIGSLQADSAVKCLFQATGINLYNIRPVVQIDSNQILGLTVKSTPNTATFLWGIRILIGFGRISGNTIKNLKSLQVSTGEVHSIKGIELFQQYTNSVAFDSVYNNEISGLYQAYTGDASSEVTAIDFRSAGNYSDRGGEIFNNHIYDLTGNSVSSSGSVNGILIGERYHKVYNNQIHGLRSLNTTVGSVPVSINGIAFLGGVPESVSLCAKNLIYDLHVHPNGTDGKITGISFNNQGLSVSNNFVGINDTSAAEIVGINAIGNGGAVVNNTVRIAGQTISGASNTSCISSAMASGVTGFTSFIRSNIFSNTRSNGGLDRMPGVATGINRAIALSAIPDYIDYNDYYYASGSMPLGNFQGTDKSTLSDWRLTTLQDCHSVTLDPQFANTDMANTVGYYPNESKLRATPEVLAADDYFGTARSATAPAMGAYERATTMLDNSTVTITSVSPIPVSIGSNLGIKGTNFIGVTGVKMNGAPANFIVNSEDSITAIVPSCARGGNTLTITTVCSEVQISNLQVTDSCVAPHIDSISPDPAGFGTWVRLYGTALNNITTATINGLPVDSIDLESCLSIRVLLPFAATSGNLAITSVCGSDSMPLNIITSIPDICCASFIAPCGGAGFDLANFTDKNVAAGKVPVGAVLTWHTDSVATAANRVANTSSVPNGVYYASYYFASQNYYSPVFLNANGSGSTVAGLCLDLNITCPDTTFNADPGSGFTFTAEQQAVLDQAYANFSSSCNCYHDPSYLYWFSSTSPDFYSNYISDVSALAPGTYYLFYAGWGGYYENFYSDPIAVTINACDSGNTCTDVWYADLDSDGYSNGDTIVACTAPAGYFAADSLVAVTGDCNDTLATVNPGVTEICGNGIDDDCNGIVDVLLPSPTITSAMAGVSSASIQFIPPAGDSVANITNYEYSIDNGTTWIPRSPASIVSPIEISGLVNCTTYNIQIRAISNTCSGASSSAVSVTTRAGQTAGSYWTLRSSAADNSWNSVAYGNGIFVAVSSSGTGNRVMTSPDGITWTSRNAAADNDWRSVTYGNGLFVAVASSGSGNRVMTSPDGITWTSQNSAANNSWYSVTYGNGLFVAVAITGTGNRVMTSPDGITWTSRNSAADNNWYSVTCGNGLFVAVAISGTGNRVMTSPDGITWTSRTSAADNEWRSVTFGNGLFVAVAGTSSGIETFDRVMTSPDGLVWTIRTCPRENRWCSVTYANGLFLAVSNNGDRNPMVSTNGIDWSMRSSALNNNWFSVIYGNGMFVAVAQSGTGTRVMTSANVLVPDKPVISSVTSSADYASVVFSGPSDIGGSAIGNYEYSLDNGITWKVPSTTFSPLTISGLMPSTAYQLQLRGVNEQGPGCPSEFVSFTTLSSATVPGVPTITSVMPGVSRGFVNFIPPANDGGGLITNYQYSLDSGATWTPLTPATMTSPLEISGLTNCSTYSVQIRAVNSAGSGPSSGTFSFTPRGGQSAGINWTIRSSAANNAWNSVTCANGQFVAVAGSGVNNRVMVSLDGINWSLRNTSVNFRWRSVVYGNGLFVAIATDGTGKRVMTSPDGLNWVTRNSAEDNEWVSVTYGNGLFVAVAINGTGNRVMTSPDGINWTARATPLNIQWYSVTYGNGLFVAVGTLGFGNGIMTSPDGINWTLRNTPADNNWFSVTYGNGQFVAVAGSGSGNRVMTSPDGINWSIQATPIGLQEWYSVTYGNGLFVAVAYLGDGDKVMTSPDGINWTIRTHAADNSWLSVTYGNGIFVSVANSGTGNRVMTSSDALVPDKPMIDSITPGIDNLNVAFTAPSDAGGSSISNYEYSIDSGSTWVTLSPASTTSPVVISGLSPATTYRVQLRAVNAQGTGCSSVMMSATTTSAGCTDIWYADIDGDGYSSGDTVIACTAPSGYYAADSLVAITGDCNDSLASVNPGVNEICFNGIDDNCDGLVDEGSVTDTLAASACGSYAWSVNGQTYTESGTYSSVSGCEKDVLLLTITSPSLWYKDADNDGYSDGTSLTQCTQPANYELAANLTDTTGDCDDSDASLNPTTVWYKDADNDGYSDGTTLTQCVQPTGYKRAGDLTATSGDCDDTNAALNPNTAWYKDADNDGYSDGTTLTQCTQPNDYELASNLTDTSGDCDDTNAALNPVTVWYKDADNDGYSDGTTLTQCTQPANYELAANLTDTTGDCDDSDAALNPTTVWYKDADNDGYSDGTTLAQCTQPAGYKRAGDLTATSGDCDDTNAALNPTTVWYKDADNDGYSDGTTLTQCTQPTDYELAANLTDTSGDCDDTNAALNPVTVWYKDADNDGYSDGTTLTQCTQPANYELAANLTDTSGDCDDTNAALNPATIWYKDADNDGYSDGSILTQCTQPTGYKRAGDLTATSGDCDDNNAALNPTTVWYKDADSDGYSDGTTLTQCTQPTGYKRAGDLSAISGDCDDSNAALNPATVWYKDADNDGYSDGTTLTQCAQPTGYKRAGDLTATSGDCDDNNAALNPTTVWYKDADNDGYSDGTTLTQCTQPTGYKRAGDLSAISGDCDDSNAALNPATVWYKDSDNDGYSDGTTLTQCTQPTGYKLASNLTATNGDCDDSNAGLNPATIWYKDADNDGYSDGTKKTQCAQPAGYKLPGNLTATSGDCDDNNSAINPATGSLVQIVYTGAFFSSTTNSSANVTLAATIKAPAGINVTRSQVRFINRDNGQPITSWLRIGLVSNADSTTGTVTAQYSVTLSSTEDARQITIGIEVGGSGSCINRNSSDDNVVINVAKPLNDFVTGGGFLIVRNPAGIKAADAGSRTNFGFNAKYNRNRTNLQGNLNAIVRRTENGTLRVYQIKANSMTSLSAVSATSTSPARATLNGRASIQDITNPLSPMSVDGNATMQVNMTDMGEPGAYDLIAITVWNKDGGMWYSSNWTGTNTVEQQIARGNIQVNQPQGAIGTGATTMSLVSSLPNSSVGQPVSFTAGIIESDSRYNATGYVIFYDNDALLGYAQISTTGRAVLTTSALRSGAHSIKAYYRGDTRFRPCESIITQNVTGASRPAESGISMNNNGSDKQELGAEIFGNPSSDLFRLKIYSNQDQRIDFRIIDATGRIREIFSDLRNGRLIQSGAALEAGVYVGELIQGKKRVTVKLVKY